MKARQRFLGAALLALACVMGDTAAEPSRVPAPDFTLKSAAGDNLKLSELRGQVVLINFWASWCGPCRQEMPLLDELHKKYQGLGFTVLGVNLDGDPAQATAFLDKVPVGFPVVFDSRNAVSKSYEVVAMPTTLIVDRNGDVRYLHKGYASGIEQEYQQQVRLLLAERR